MALHSATERLLVLRLRKSRQKAREAAVGEVLGVLRGLRARRASGGPASETAGVAWVSIDSRDLGAAFPRFHGLGYTSALELVTPIKDLIRPGRSIVTRWRGRDVGLVPLWTEPDTELRANAPDRRSFLLECASGATRRINGYRGGNGPLEHRALAVEDARLLVNLVRSDGGTRLLDPFAGAGGVIIEARSRGFTTTSVDIDRALRFGLSELSGDHVVGDARVLPFADQIFDAVATEPPYHPGALETVVAVIWEAARVTRSNGRIAFLVSS